MARPERFGISLVMPEQGPLQQSSLLDQWEVLNLHLTHELLRFQRLGPLMIPAEVLIMAGEWSLFAQMLDQIETTIKLRTMAHAKAVGLIA